MIYQVSLLVWKGNSVTALEVDKFFNLRYAKRHYNKIIENKKLDPKYQYSLSLKDISEKEPLGNVVINHIKLPEKDWERTDIGIIKQISENNIVQNAVVDFENWLEKCPCDYEYFEKTAKFQFSYKDFVFWFVQKKPPRDDGYGSEKCK